MTYVKDYVDIIGAIYGRDEKVLGLLSLDLVKNKGPVEREDIGNIDEQCWKHLRELLASNPISSHIKFN